MKTIATCKPILTLGTALSALLFAGAVHAWAAVTADPAVAPPTGQVAVSGAHFTPNSLVEVFLKWKRCSVTTDAQGQFGCTFKVPKVLEPGTKKIWTVNRANGRWVSTAFTVRTDWGNEAFDAGRTRYNPYENLINRANVNQLKKLWAAPGALQLVAEGRVFVFVRVSRFVRAGIVALDERDGREAWHDTANSLYDSPPAVARGQLFTMSDFASPEYPDDPEGNWSMFRALRTTDGHESWAVVRSEGGQSVSARFAVSGEWPDRVYYAEFSAGFSWVRSYSVAARDTSDGRMLWEHRLGGSRGGDLPSMVISGARLSASFSFAADPESAWRDWENAVLDAGDGTIIQRISRTCSEYYTLECFDILRWDDPLAYLNPALPQFKNAGFGQIVQIGVNDSGLPMLFVLDAGTLTPIWTWTAAAGTSIAVPALTPNTLYVTVTASDQMRLYAFRTADGAVRWQRVIDRSEATQPTVANGVIYLGNRAYDARNGNLLWTNPDLVDTVSPIVVNGQLYANQTDGNVSAWGLK